MSFAYRFGGLAIRSSIALPGLRAADAPAADLDIRLVDGPAPAPDAVVYTWRGRYRTWLGTLGDDWIVGSALDGVFVINRAIGIVRAYSSAPPPHAELTDVLVRRILPRLVTARGGIAIHGAGVATADGAVLLLGRSGAGKSTLTAALAATPGWQLLSDDLTLLRPGTPASVEPGATGVCVWPASRDGLAIVPAACTPMPGYDGKVRFDPPGEPTLDQAPLRAIVLLDRDGAIHDPALVPAVRSTALIEAARQLILFNPAAPPAEENAPLFRRFSGAVASVPMLHLRYPSNYAVLPRVAELLAEVTR